MASLITKNNKVRMDLLRAHAFLTAIAYEKAELVNVDMDDLINFVCVLLAQADTALRPLLGQEADLSKGAYPYVLPDPKVTSANLGNNKIITQATTAFARWVIDVPQPPADIKTLIVAPALPPAQRARLREVGFVPQAAIVATLVGVGLACVGGLAYWAGKREDRLATIETSRIRTGAALSGATAIAAQQIKAGQAVSPEILKVFQEGGGNAEAARSWGVPASIVVGSLGVVVGVGGAIALSRGVGA